MSLINDALKKAQKQRTGDSPPLSGMPGVGGEPAAKIARRDKPAGFNAQLTRLAVGAGGVLLVVLAGGFFILRISHRAPPLTPVPPAATVHPAPGTPPPAAPAEKAAVTFTLPVAPPPVAEPAPAVVSSITASAGGEHLAPTAPPGPQAAAPNLVAPMPDEGGTKPAPAPPSPAAPVKLDPKAINFIDNLRIAGIRASATDSKVLMNDHVFRVGDIVEHQLGLKLTAISADSLGFEDERGGKYVRNF
jgi:hypothetical protein